MFIRIYTIIAFLARITNFVVFDSYANESGVKPPHSILRPINAIGYRYHIQQMERWQEKKGKMRGNEKKSLKKEKKILKKDVPPIAKSERCVIILKLA